MALNKEISEKADIQSDEAAFYYIKPREVLWINDLYTTVGDDDQSILAVNPLYLVGPHSILPNPVLEFNPMIAVAVTAAFEEEPTAEAKAVEVAECIVMVGKKQFDMMMGGDQESDSASSLTTAITHVKLKPPDERTIPEDDSGLPEDNEDIADEDAVECNTVADEVVNTPVINDTPASVPSTGTKPKAQAIPPRASKVVVNPDHVNFLLTLLCALTNHSAILDDAYGSSRDTFFLHIHIRHAESLRDLNAC